MTQQLQAALKPLDPAAVRSIILDKNVRGLSEDQRAAYIVELCEHIGISWLSKPFDFIPAKKGGGLIVYANKDCAAQLRKVYGVTLKIGETWEAGGNIFVRIHARDKFGREDEDIGFAPIKSKVGEDYGDAYLKAVTKGKRRVTLSICGLGFLDETEVEAVDIHSAPRPPQKEGSLFKSLANPEPKEQEEEAKDVEFTDVEVAPTKREVADGLASVIEEAVREFNSGTDPAECDALVESFVNSLPKESRDLIPFWNEALNLAINKAVTPVEAIRAAAEG